MPDPSISREPNSKETILLVDDDGYFQKTIAAILCKCGYRVLTASSGEEALQKAKEFDGTIHLLLSDVVMPGMNGLELAVQFKRARPDTNVLLISGFDSGLQVHNSGWQFLAKPFMPDMLRNRIRDLLSKVEDPSRKTRNS